MQKQWYVHEQHGYLLAVDDGQGYPMHIFGLLQNLREIEEDAGRWNALKVQLRVNAESGAIAFDEACSLHSSFKPCNEGQVPAHIIADFEQFLKEGV
jgi:hypothetical protein